MWKYAVMRIKDNDEEIVRWCKSKDEAMLYGAEFFLAPPKGEGIVSAEEVAIEQHGCLGDGHILFRILWKSRSFMHLLRIISFVDWPP